MTNLRRIRKGDTGQTTTNAGHFATKQHSEPSGVSLTSPIEVPRHDPSTPPLVQDPEAWTAENAAEWRAIREEGGQALAAALASCGITVRPALAESGALYDAVSDLMESSWYRARQRAARS